MALIDSYPTSNYSGTLKGLSSGDNLRLGETFTPGANYTLTSVQFYLGQDGISGNVTATLYATSAGVPTGSALVTSNVRNANTFTGTSGSLALESFTFATPYSLVSGTTYCIALEKNNAGIVYFGCDGTSPIYAGKFYQYTSSWSEDSATDAIFYVYGDLSNNSGFFNLM